MEQQDCEEDQFYRVLQENLKYAFTSPMATTHAFPTPYSHSQQTKKDMKLTSMGAGLTIDDANDSSLVENSMLPLQGLGHGSNTGGSGNNGSVQTLGGESSGTVGHGGSSGSGGVGKTGKTTSLNDVNAQPSMVLNFENFPNEIFLDSSDQFKEFREFLQDSPASVNLWQAKTPAKTPLKFLQQQHLQLQLQQQHTPLQDIDINLMFNSGAKSTVSPSKRLYSLTPYSRKVFGELDTPHRTVPPSSSSNSALVDFQRARKEHANFLMKTPVAKKARQLNNKRPDVFNSTSTSSPSFVSSLVPSAMAEAGGLHTAPTSVSVNSTTEADGAEGAAVNSTRDDADDDIYGSSPTTIQLASSVTKSARVANLGESPPVGSQRDPTVDSRLFDISASPTPKLNKTQSTHTIPLRVPELPKLGSFKSVTARPQLIPNNIKTRSGTNSSTKTTLPTVFVGANTGRIGSGGLSISKFAPKNKSKPKSGQQQHSTFQFIMTNANSFNINNDGNSLPPKKKLKRTQSSIVSSEQRTQTGGSSSNEVMISTPINQYKTGKKRKRNLSLSQ